jgi:hypothetical protein
MTQDLPHDGHDEFRKAFAQALFEPLDRFSGGLAGSLSAQAGFAVYRNTVAKACIDALAANFPVVLRLVGAAWFHAMAASYVRQQPPRDARLLRYGEGLPAFLQEFATAHSLAYLYGVASLDWYWTQAHISADAVPNEKGEAFYQVRIETKTPVIEAIDKKLSIIPGMQAQIDIVTGKRTILQFLSKPLIALKENAFRER